MLNVERNNPHTTQRKLGNISVHTILSNGDSGDIHRYFLLQKIPVVVLCVLMQRVSLGEKPYKKAGVKQDAE